MSSSQGAVNPAQPQKKSMDHVVAEIWPDQPFSFRSALYAHGWAELGPFRVDQNAHILYYSWAVPEQRIIEVKITDIEDSGIQIRSFEKYTPLEVSEIIQLAQHIFRLDENFEEFYETADRHREFRWIRVNKAGRLLRSASVWEDMVKTLCTTNCSWHLTKLMTGNIVNRIGHGKRFPDTAEIASYDETFLRKEIKLGYRAPYLLEMARNILSGAIDPESWKTWTGSTEELFNIIRKVKGFGEYAVGSLLKLLGRYDYIGLDSWGRKAYAERYNNGKFVNDEVIHTKYDKFGKWSGLFYWMDLTRDLYH